MKNLWRALGVSLFVASFPATALAQTYHVPILMYHNVVEIGPGTARSHYPFYVPPKIFEAELRYLQQRQYHAMFVKDVAAAMAAQKPLPKKAIALTFDDGTADFSQTVLPLLKKYHLRATLFANPGFNGTDGRLTWNEILDAHQSGLVEIGAHTMMHENLTLLSAVDARAEIEDSKTELERITGAPVVSFAYPFGAHTPTIDALVQNAGFQSSVISDRIGTENSDTLFAIPRVRIGDDTEHIEKFIQKLKY